MVQHTKQHTLSQERSGRSRTAQLPSSSLAPSEIMLAGSLVSLPLSVASAVGSCLRYTVFGFTCSAPHFYGQPIIARPHFAHIPFSVQRQPVSRKLRRAHDMLVS